jgi:site-specific DNA recombinase
MLDRVSGKPKTIRCAIYTRKSSEEGLEQDFNSLHAQREACEAYVISQRHEGWKAIGSAYDDGGFSGGSMERPGLKRLLADIHAGLIDIIVVYKVDRLTRSLTDFAKMVDAFDAKGVSFVSVTQSFNTTSSMGRLTLNVLLSFAQFEREVTGERIRDKIAASKKKGLWMGGFAPMGYAADGRSLKIVEEPAAIIRRIFERFLALGSVLRLKEELDGARVTTAAFKSASNRDWGGRSFSIGHLRWILNNPIYVGEIAHAGERYRAQHEAIIDRDTFGAVQQHLTVSKRQQRIRGQAKDANLLAHLLFDADGKGLGSDHAVKKSRRYRYYVTKPDVSDPMRIPAGEIEPLVIQALATRLCDRSWLMANLLEPVASPDNIQHLTREAASLAGELQHAIALRQREAVHRLVERITIRRDGLRIELKSTPFGSAASFVEGQGGVNDDAPPAAIDIEARFVKRGQDLHLVVPPGDGADATARLDKSLIKAVARAATWYDDLVHGWAASMREIAAAEDVSERYVAQLLPLAFLKPGLVEGCLDGTTDLRITGANLAKGLDLHREWPRQVDDPYGVKPQN